MNTLSFESMLNAVNVSLSRNGGISKFMGFNTVMIVTGTLDSANVASVCHATLANKRAPKARQALAAAVLEVTETFREQLQAERDAIAEIVTETVNKEVAASSATPTEIEVSTTKQWLYVTVGGIKLHFNRAEIASKGMLTVVETVGRAVKDETTKRVLRLLWTSVKRNQGWWSADSITRRDYEWRVNDMLETTKRFGGTFASNKQAEFYHQMKSWLAEHGQAA